MAICTAEGLVEQLNLPADLATVDQNLLARKLAAAQNHVERLLGLKIEDTYGGVDQDPVPPALVEATYQLAAHWYENRESVLVGVVGQSLPIGLLDIVNEFRVYSFDG